MDLNCRRPSRTTSLDGVWEFSWLGDGADLSDRSVESGGPLRAVAAAAVATHGSGPIAVPGCFDAMPSLAGARGTGVYRRCFEQTPDQDGYLVFHGLGIWAAVYVDGALACVHRKPYSAFAVLVPRSTARVRDLAVVVDNRFDTARSPLQENYFDFYAYGGLFRSVEHIEVPQNHFTSVVVSDADLSASTVRVGVRLSQDGPCRIECAVDGGEWTSPTVDDRDDRDDGDKAVGSFSVHVPDARPWTPENPVLHSLCVRVVPDGDEVSVRFGLRTVAVDGPRILLNGKPIRLFGWNRHEGHPQYGPALPLAQLVADIQLMKQAGANFVRGSHYPQDERFLDLCDEFGLLVWEESIGWQQEERHFANGEYVDLIVEQQRQMIRAHINHPSIIMWGFQNELHSEIEAARPVVEALARECRANDASRPVTFATCRFPNDLCMDLVDIVSINTYPAWYSQRADEYRPLHEVAERVDTIKAELRAQRLDDKPLILSEIGAGAIYGWRDPHDGPWSEQYQSDYLELVCTAFRDDPSIAGLALWQFCDCRTYGSSRSLSRPRGFNNKGVLDEYRRAKLAYRTVVDLDLGSRLR